MADIDFRLPCWYKEGCNAKDYNCEKVCHRYLEMNYLINNCGMKNASKFLKPLNPEEGDIQTFEKLQEIKDNIVSFVKEAKNLFIASPQIETGKTSWALKIMYKYFDEIWAGNGFKRRGYFLYVPEFLNNIKSFEYKNSDEFKTIDKILRTTDLVVWDDLTTNQLSPQEQAIINTYIDKRVLEGLSNIYDGLFYKSETMVQYLGLKLSQRILKSELAIIKGKKINNLL